MVIDKTVLRDCYERSNPSQFDNLTVIDYNYYPECVVIHSPVTKKVGSKNPNTHRLAFRRSFRDSKDTKITYTGLDIYGINYNELDWASLPYVRTKTVVFYKKRDPIFLSFACHNDLFFLERRPTRHQVELISGYAKRCNRMYFGFDFYRRIKKFKTGETFENKYHVHPKLAEKLINNSSLELFEFQQQFRKGLDFYRNVRLTSLSVLFNLYGKEPFFKQIYNYASYDCAYETVPNYIDYMRMRDELLNGKCVQKKDWPVAPTVDNIKKLHDKILPIFNRYLEVIQDKKLQKKQKIYASKHYKEAKAYELSNDDFLITACKKLSELVTEGRELHHCVGSYAESVSEGKEYILFLRRKSDPETPFFTIDVTPEKVVRQIHSNYNCNITSEVKPFINEWVKKFELTFDQNRCLCHL